MQAFLKLAISFLGLNPFVLAILSAGIFGTGIYLQIKENEANLSKADALLSGPPPAVPLEAIRAATEAHPYGEVTVQAQMATSMEQAFVVEGAEERTLTYMVPLLAADATEMDVRAVLLIEDKPLAGSGAATVDLGPGAQGEGDFGPVLLLNGMVGTIADIQGPLADVFSGEWSDVPADLPVLKSFEGDRAAAYGPSWPLETSIFGLFAWIGGAVGLYALVRSAVHFRPKPVPEARDDAEAEARPSKIMRRVRASV